MADDTQVQPRTKVLANGAVYDLDRKRIVANPGGGLAAFDSDTARQAQAQRQERKRAAMLAAANEAVERGDYRQKHGDLAFVAAIAETAYIKATTPEDPKAIDAARFLLQETGMAEAKQAETVNNTVNVIQIPAEVAQVLAELHGRLTEQIREGEVVE